MHYDPETYGFCIEVMGCGSERATIMAQLKEAKTGRTKTGFIVKISLPERIKDTIKRYNLSRRLFSAIFVWPQPHVPSSNIFNVLFTL